MKGNRLFEKLNEYQNVFLALNSIIKVCTTEFSLLYIHLFLFSLWHNDLAGQLYAEITRSDTHLRACGTIRTDGIIFWPASKRHIVNACIRSVSPQSIPY